MSSLTNQSQQTTLNFHIKYATVQ